MDLARGRLELLLYPGALVGAGGWLLASWVCLFRRCELDQPDAESW